MPVTEAVSHAHDGDVAVYELAYHILPTVAEGEVEAVTGELKALLTAHNAVITDEEVAARFELAYEIEKYLEGKYRRFSSAYFGWIRFTIAPAQLVALDEEIRGNKKVLRHLTIRLTAVEEASPFRFHEAVRELTAKVTTVDTDDTIVAEATADEVVSVPEVADATEAEVEKDETSNA
jgi:ribosomal protein S6